jgi:cell division protein FtsQ
MTIIEEPRGLARGADPGDRGDWSEWSDWSDGSDGSDGSDAAHDQGPAAASDEVPRAAERAADAATATPAAEPAGPVGGPRPSRWSAALDWVAAPADTPRFGVRATRVPSATGPRRPRPARRDRTDAVHGATSAAATGRTPRERPAVGQLAPDPRIAERRRRVEQEAEHEAQERRSSRWIAVGVLTGLLAVVVGGVALLMRSPLLEVRTISVDGAAMTGAEAVVTAGGVRIGDSMFRVDTGAVARRISDLDTVATARVERKWPDSLRIVVTERIAVAAVRAGDLWLTVDRDGAVLTTVVSAPSLVRLTVSEPMVVASGSTLPSALSPVDARAAALVADLPDAVRRRLDPVRVERGSVVGTVTTAGARIEVVFGRPDDAVAKGRALLTVLQGADPDSIRLLDLSVPDVPIVTRR